MAISVFSNQKDLKIDKGSVKVLVKEVLKFLKVSFKEVAIYFVTKKKITHLHDQFFQDPTPTDCISFPIDSNHLGEIFVCPKVAFEYAKEKGLDPIKECTLYIIHGLLHLIGFDDLDPKDRSLMRRKEKSCMNHLDQLMITIKCSH